MKDSAGHAVELTDAQRDCDTGKGPETSSQKELPMLDESQYAGSRLRSAVWVYRIMLFLALGAAAAIGGPVVAPMAIAAAFFSIWADREGALRHGIRLGGFALAVAAAPLLGILVGNLLSTSFGAPKGLASAGSVLVIGIVILFVAGLLGRRWSKPLRAKRVAGAVDRVLGSAMGAAEGALLVAVFFWTVSAFSSPLHRLNEQAAAGPAYAPLKLISLLDTANDRLATDRAGQVIVRNNPLPKVGAIHAMQDIAEVASDRDAMGELMDKENFDALLAEPAIAPYIDRIQADPQLRQAVEDRDVAAIMQSQPVLDMLADRAVYDTLMRRIRELRRAVEAGDADGAMRIADQARREAESAARRFGVQSALPTP